MFSALWANKKKGAPKWTRSSELSRLEPLLLLPVSPRKGRIQRGQSGGKLCARCKGFRPLVSESLLYPGGSFPLCFFFKISLRFSQVVSKWPRPVLRTGFEFLKCFCQLSTGQLQARINSTTTRRVVALREALMVYYWGSLS